jgi:hypothetical protein
MVSALVIPSGWETVWDGIVPVVTRFPGDCIRGIGGRCQLGGFEIVWIAPSKGQNLPSSFNEESANHGVPGMISLSARRFDMGVGKPRQTTDTEVRLGTPWKKWNKDTADYLGKIKAKFL